MNVDEIKRLIHDIVHDPSVLGAERDEIDELLVNIIRVEKKHLYGVQQTSAQRRQEEIESFIDAYSRRLVEGE